MKKHIENVMSNERHEVCTTTIETNTGICFTITCVRRNPEDMKHKKLCGKASILPIIHFFESEDEEVQKIINDFNDAVDFDIQLDCIKSFSALLESDATTTRADRVLIWKLLAFVFLACEPLHPLRKTIHRILQSFSNPGMLTDLFVEVIKMQIDFIASLRTTGPIVFLKKYLITSMSGSIAFKPLTDAIHKDINLVYDFTVSLFSKMVDYFTERHTFPADMSLDEVQFYIHHAVKFLIAILQKNALSSVCEQKRLTLIKLCYDVLISKQLSNDVKGNCGYLMVILFTKLPEEIVNESRFKKTPYIEFLLFGLEPTPGLDKLGLKVVDDSEILETFRISISWGISIIATFDVLQKVNVRGEMVLITMFKDFLTYRNDYSAHPFRAVVSSKVLSVLAPRLDNLPYDMVAPLYNLTFKYILLYLDDKQEVVRANVKILLESMIGMALKYFKDGKPEQLEFILDWMRSLAYCDARYKTLAVVCTKIGCVFYLSKNPDLPTNLLNELNYNMKLQSISMCYETLMQSHLNEEKMDYNWAKYWVEPLLEALRDPHSHLTSVYQKLFVTAFILQPKAIKYLIKERYLTSDAELVTFLSCIHLVRKRGLQMPDEVYTNLIDRTNCWRSLLPYSTLEVLQTHQNDEVRVLILAIVVDSQRTTEPFTDWEIEFIVKFLCYNINTSNASSRQQIIEYIKKALVRAQNVITMATKKELTESSKKHVYLFKSLVTEVLIPALHPDSNYARRSTALELFLFLIDCNVESLPFRKQDVLNIKYIVQSDTYERNKEMASKLLSIFHVTQLGFDSQKFVQKHLDKCFLMMESIKPTETIAAAYMLKVCLRSNYVVNILQEKLKKIENFEEQYDVSNQSDALYLVLLCLLYELQNCYKIGEVNLQEAASKKPIHGYVFCIRLLLDIENLSKQIETFNWRALFRDLLYWCFQLSKLMKAIICNQSPEGYLPDESDLELTGTDETAKAQMVTVYGWRAAKEISLLLGKIISDAPFFGEEHPQGLIDEQQILSIGDYFFNLLVNTKHRGAFEQASIGYTNLCHRLWRIPVTNIKQLPEQWLERIFHIVLDGDENVETCATRRSAGVPFMIQSLLITATDDKHFQTAIKILLKIAADTSNAEEQRIHCLNILRALYRHNQLSEQVMPFCAQGMMIAIEGYRSEVWSIRNASTLLFSALMIRIFGVLRTRDTEEISSKNKMIVQVFLMRFPELYGFLIKELKKGIQEQNYPSLFLVLLVLNRLYRQKEKSETFTLTAYKSYIFCCLHNTNYRIRELAARTYVNLLLPCEVNTVVYSCFCIISNTTIANTYCNGIMLLLQNLLPHFHFTGHLNIARVLDRTSWIIAQCHKQVNRLNAAIYLEVLNELILKFDSKYENCEFYKLVSIILSWQNREDCFDSASTASRKYLLEMFNLKLSLLLHIAKCHLHKNELRYKFIKQDLENQSIIRNMCISYVHYLEFSSNKYQGHCLFEDDDEFSEMINKRLKPLNSGFRVVLYKILYDALSKTLTTNKHIRKPNLEENLYLKLFTLHRFTTLEENTQTLAKRLVKLSLASEEQIARTAIAYLDSFLSKLNYSELAYVDLNDVFNVILKYSLPSVDTSFRVGVCNLLIHNIRLFTDNTKWHVKWSNLCIMWEAIFILLEDDEAIVRNTISRLVEENHTVQEKDYVFVPPKRIDISEYSREKLLGFMSGIVPAHCSIDILLSWILRGRVKMSSSNLSEVFDEGEQNTYAEQYPMAKAAAECLHNILWKLDDGMNFDDKSIFIEEQFLVIATMLYDKFMRSFVPMISEGMNAAMKSIFARIIIYLERVVVNSPSFKADFKKVLNEAVNREVVKALGLSEILRLKMFLSKIFKVVLWD